MNNLDIGFKKEGLAQKLSNLYPHKFDFDGITYRSYEGFIQALKYKKKFDKDKIHNMYGYEAWHMGQLVNWKSSMVLYYQDKELDRFGDEYRELIKLSYDALCDNIEFRNYLIESSEYRLIHTIGKTNPNETILTNAEFLGNLNRLRDNIKPNKYYSLF